MPQEPFYKAHWRQIDPDRMAAYKDGFAWSDATEQLYQPAQISEGQNVADFGCGPGKVSVEIARRVGELGHVHAIDINEEFLQIVSQNAETAGVSSRLTTHLNDGEVLPLESNLLDRVTARNTLMYVDDPVVTLAEFHRMLKPGGIAHAIDGDWYMMVVQPIDPGLWYEFVGAASHACRNSDMGRKLYGCFAQANFQRIEVALVANVDVEGRLAGMIRNMAKYARQSGTLDHGKIDRVLHEVEQAQRDGTYLAVSPQFVVTGQRAV